MTDIEFPKSYACSVVDADGKLIAAEFVEGLPIKVLDAIERWTDQTHEFRIKRVMETMPANKTDTRAYERKVPKIIAAAIVIGLVVSVLSVLWGLGQEALAFVQMVR